MNSAYQVVYDTTLTFIELPQNYKVPCIGKDVHPTACCDILQAEFTVPEAYFINHSNKTWQTIAFFGVDFQRWYPLSNGNYASSVVIPAVMVRVAKRTTPMEFMW